MRGLKTNSRTDDPLHNNDQIVLVVMSDGQICDVLQGLENSVAEYQPELNGTNINTHWSPEHSAQIMQLIKRTIRTRQVHSNEFGDESSGNHYESIVVPHGRDRALMIVRDMSARKNEIEKIQKLAYVDDVTKLPNREFLLEELDGFAEKARLTESRVAVICIEVDQIDNHGNSFSSRELDVILEQMANRLTHELRGANQPDYEEFERYSIAARIDFRRFGVVLPSLESGTDAENIAHRLCDSLQQPVKIGTRKISVMTRAGISLFPQDGTDADTLFENSLVAMEDAWSGHTTHIKFHSGTVKLRALHRGDVEQELKAALDKEEFVLHFLPIVDSTSRKVSSVESLLRWPQTVLGSQPIQKVVSIAEQTGLILPIGNWVLKRSCEQLQTWHESGLTNLRIAVNLSAQEFARSDLAQHLHSIVDDHAIDPSFVDLEINEYMLFRDAMKDYTVCKSLKELGFGVVVDDYGTGACSLAHLARSPVNAIKIDNSFVSNSETDETDRATCAAVSALANELGLRVIAEGVETESQATMLQKQGCSYLQGFHFCHPAPADEMSQYLNRTRLPSGSE